MLLYRLTILAKKKSKQKSRPWPIFEHTTLIRSSIFSPLSITTIMTSKPVIAHEPQSLVYVPPKAKIQEAQAKYFHKGKLLPLC